MKLRNIIQEIRLNNKLIVRHSNIINNVEILDFFDERRLGWVHDDFLTITFNIQDGWDTEDEPIEDEEEIELYNRFTDYLDLRKIPYDVKTADEDDDNMYYDINIRLKYIEFN